MLKRFLSDRRGNFAALTVGISIPLLLAVGLSVDYTRYLSAHDHLQEATDAIALMLAASKERDETKLTTLANQMLATNKSNARIETASVFEIKSTNDAVEVKLNGSIEATFMGLAGYEKLNTSSYAKAERAVTGGVELALILDNTDSMKHADPKTKITKINAVKTAAAKLVDELMTNADGAVKVSLVPFADYVNVGLDNRNASWLNVAADSSKVTPGKCTEVTSKTVCDEYAPKYACTKVSDGVEYQTTCGGGCVKSHTEPVNPPTQSCSKDTTTYTKWYGCVASRVTATKPYQAILDDGSSSVRYPGIMDSNGYTKCPIPIIPLTSTKQTIKDGIAGMVTSRSGWTPYTYIPSGLIWGLNVLSQTEPFTQGGAYDSKNQKPRKVAVLMTDGENTKYLNLANTAGLLADMATGWETGTFDKSKYDAGQLQIKPTNDNTAAICKIMKDKKIEIFTVAFMLDDANAKTLLESCATDKDHYFDASDSDKLAQAFGTIGNSLRVVRLTK